MMRISRLIDDHRVEGFAGRRTGADEAGVIVDALDAHESRLNDPIAAAYREVPGSPQ
jgi:hypothetical protein